MSDACCCPVGHSFCYSCIYRNITVFGESRCPCDNAADEGRQLTVESLRPVLNMQQLIDNLTVRCRNEGCSWTGRRASYDNHLNSCEFGIVKCSFPDCREEMRRAQVAEHRLICLHRMVNCSGCQEEMKAGKLDEHIRVQCSHTLVSCRFNCGERIIRYYIASVL